MWPLLALVAAASCSDGTCEADAVGLLQLKQWAQGVPHCRPHCPEHCDAENCATECADISSETCTKCAEETGCEDCLTCFRGEESDQEECMVDGKKCFSEDSAKLLETASRVEAAPDKSTFCGGWAAAGECERNPAYMNANCATSCAKDDGGGGSADLGPIEKKVDDIKTDVAKIKSDVADIKAAQARTPSPTPAPDVRRRRTPSPTPSPRRRRTYNPPRRRAPVSSGKCCYETCQRGQCASGLFC